MNIYVETFIFAIILLVIDGMWIGLYMGKKYRTLLGDNMKNPVDILAVAFAYMTMILAYPILIKQSSNDTLYDILIRASVCGFVIYGTYGFTLAAILQDYDMCFAFTEVVWGTFLYALTSLIVYYIK